MKQIQFVVILAVVMCAMLTGCVSSGPQYLINIANYGDSPAENVILEAGGEVKYRISSLEQDGRSGFQKLDQMIPYDCILRWQDGGGKAHSASLSVPEKYRKGTFKGRINVEIKSEDKAMIFLTPASGEENSGLPWTTPEAWEGAPTIPGLN